MRSGGEEVPCSWSVAVRELAITRFVWALIETHLDIDMRNVADDVVLIVQDGQ